MTHRILPIDYWQALVYAPVTALIGMTVAWHENPTVAPELLSLAALQASVVMVLQIWLARSSAHDTGSGSHCPPRFDEDGLREVAAMKLVTEVVARPHAVGLRQPVWIVRVSSLKISCRRVPVQVDPVQA